MYIFVVFFNISIVFLNIFSTLWGERSEAERGRSNFLETHCSRLFLIFYVTQGLYYSAQGLHYAAQLYYVSQGLYYTAQVMHYLVWFSLVFFDLREGSLRYSPTCLEVS